ncbi:MAG: cytochrome b N-terminal domain-containing protein [bacterium]
MANHIKNLFVQSKAWKSIFRTGVPRSNLDRSYLIFNNLFLHIFPVKVKRTSLAFKATYFLGVTAFALFVILVVTGIYLMLYYHPSIPQAYQDMKDLEFVVSSGRFIRNMHRWAAHGMVAVVFLHLLRVFYAGAYRPPKQFNWVVGVVLFLLTLLLSYTGYLLPWDQLALWGISVGTNMLGYAPLIGKKFRFLLLGGNIVSENALLRFYVLHVLVLPLFMTILIGIHFWRVRKDGGITPLAKSETEVHKKEGR